MPLKIRLARAGSKKRPYYHVVVADARSPRDGRFIESLGSWNPLLPKDGERVKVDADRVKHWLSHGAQPTDRVLRFLDEAGIAKRDARSNPKKAEHGLPPADPAREQQQITRLRQLANDAHLDPDFAEKFLNFVVREVIRHHEQIAASNGASKAG